MGFRSTFCTICVLLAVLSPLRFPCGQNGCASASTVKAAKAKTTLAQIHFMEEAIIQFRKDTGRYPTGDEGLAALRVRPPETPGWKGPYLAKEIPRDPWGHTYAYRYPPKYGVKEFDLYSFGPDGHDDFGAHDDITNWKESDFKGSESRSAYPLLLGLTFGVLSLTAMLMVRRAKGTPTAYALCFAAFSHMCLAGVGILAFLSSLQFLFIPEAVVFPAVLAALGAAIVGTVLSVIAAIRNGWDRRVLLALALCLIPLLLLGVMIILPMTMKVS